MKSPLGSVALLLAFSLPACAGSEWKPVAMNVALPVAPAPPDRPAPPPKVVESPPATTYVQPVAGDLPADLSGKLEVDLSCGDNTCSLDDAAAAADGENRATALSASFAHARSTLRMARYSEQDVYGVVVRGTVKLRGSEDASGRSVGAWIAFHFPGGGAEIIAESADSHVVLAIVPARKREGRKTALKGWKKRPAAIETFDLGAAKDLAWADGAMHARTAFEGDAQPASFGVLIASSTASVPPHQHETSREVLATLRGDGTIERGFGGETRATGVHDGSVIVVPPGTRHAWFPSGKSPLVAIQIYAPPGPEQRFKDLAKAAGARAPR